MPVMSLFKTPIGVDAPLDASRGHAGKTVSSFVTVQSLSNFAAMTGAISAAWHALQRLSPVATSLWVPYGFALAWAVVSLAISSDGFERRDGKGREWGTIAGAVFVALLNALVLAGAVVGTDVAVGRAS